MEHLAGKPATPTVSLTRTNGRRRKFTMGDPDPLHELVGGSSSMLELREIIQTISPTDVPVLLLGETGTGKELAARAIHRSSLRRIAKLVTVNCAALPESLMEAELFGHERGAFTGAVDGRLGRIPAADRGTLFLDEIGELPIQAQAKLLRVVESGHVDRIGDYRARSVDVRTVAATNRNLLEDIRAGRFRADLYYRLNVMPIVIPPLRERIEDLKPLVSQFLSDLRSRLGKPLFDLTHRSWRWMESYDWPGNVRELKNLVERAAVLAKSSTLDVEPPPHPQPTLDFDDGLDRSRKLDDVMRRHIHRVLKSAGWVIDGEHGAAARLDMKPSTLRYRMKKLGIARKQQ